MPHVDLWWTTVHQYSLVAPTWVRLLICSIQISNIAVRTIRRMHVHGLRLFAHVMALPCIKNTLKYPTAYNITGWSIDGAARWTFGQAWPDLKHNFAGPAQLHGPRRRVARPVQTSNWNTNITLGWTYVSVMHKVCSWSCAYESDWTWIFNFPAETTSII